MTEFIVHVENRPGRLATITELLGEAGVNIEALAAYGHDGEGVLRLIVDDAATTRRSGAAIRAPADALVVLAEPDLHLTGGTLLLDHGHGLSSNFLHLSRLDVAVGDRVEQGQVIGAVGATGRATGPHLHWGMSWFDVRIDPQLVLERAL